MNNTGKKILILSVALILAVAGILAFYPTIVAPPAKVPVRNLHKISLEDDIDKFSESASRKFNDSVYDVVSDKIAIYGKEQFLTPEETDTETKRMVQEYVPIFCKSCYAMFNSPVWSESGLNGMEKRIAELKSLKLSDGSNVVAGSSISDLNDVASIIKNYRDAKVVAGYSEFRSVIDATAKIRLAQKYMDMEYLKNCSDLHNKLSGVKKRLGNSHYSKVAGKVEEMSEYRSMSESSFKTLTSSVNNAIKEYEDSRSHYGTSAKSADDLKVKANRYYTEATEYYSRDFKRQIEVDTQGQWALMNSPNLAFRAYRSVKNYHWPGATALMSFTVTGCDNFTFYIRSNGENDNDYLVVGIDKIPTKSSYYASTKGKSTAGTLFSNYSPVELKDLVKDRKYRIYVVYIKDATVDYGEDRGYVLIPY